MKDNFKVILKKIPNLVTGQRFILGIDGLSRSGKTTLVKKLIQVLGEKNVQVCVFHIDDYIVERNKRYNTGHEEWFEYYNLQWDIRYLRDFLFRKLKVSNQLNLPYYDNESDAHRVKHVIIPDTCVLVVEGVFLQRQEWRSFFDFLVYLDCPRDKRFSRESESIQKNIEKFRNRYWKAEDYYIMTEIPIKKADLVIKC